MSEFQPDHLRLTDFMDVQTLQEIQDSFAAVANVKATITDAQGTVLTQPVPTKAFLRRQRAIADAEANTPDSPQKEGRVYVAPIMVAGQRLGTLRMSNPGSASFGLDEERLAALTAKFGIDPRRIRQLIAQVNKNSTTRTAAIQFLFMLANAIARLCYQEFQLRQRITELTAVYNLTMLLADTRDLQSVLQKTVQLVAEVMECKASSIRLVDPEHDELVIKAVYNLSREYLNKGRVR